jgi:hypothetical protein
MARYKVCILLDFLMFEIWILGIVIVPFFVWRVALRVYRTPIEQFKGEIVLILTAHPDDECMFFSPTIQSLTRTAQVHVLCLSLGY